MEATPRLSTYAVAEGLIQQFPDILVIGKLSKGAKSAHRFQFESGVQRVAKDAAGVVRKMINFSPRITGGAHGKTEPADMKEILKIIKKGL